MPRLIGQRFDSSSSVALIVLLVLAAGISLEYLGYVNVIPRFGRTIPYNSPEKMN